MYGRHRISVRNYLEKKFDLKSCRYIGFMDQVTNGSFFEIPRKLFDGDCSNQNSRQIMMSKALLFQLYQLLSYS